MRIYLRTFGCRANHYDGETVRAMLDAAGHEVVDTPAEAEAAVFNSCAVTADAEADLRQQVRRAARENPGLTSIVMGCASALPTADALRTLPSVQAVLAGADFAGVAATLGLPPATAELRSAAQAGTRATLRIQDGCDEHCTFCATTIARGANRSRAPETLLDEARRLAERHPEIVLTGVHIGSYGADCGRSLGWLVERLVHAVPEVRFRLSSIEATEVDARLGALMVGLPQRLAPHLHAPLQSGSDRVLRRMGRHWYTPSTYGAAVERLAAAAPVLGLGADVIAGFPGETDADHAATLALVEALPFTYLHVFPYSPRPGTAATRLSGAVAPAVARERARELREAAARKGAAYRAARDGGRADVVWEGGAERRAGLTEDYLSVLPPALPPARGERAPARLRRDGERLIAEPGATS